MEISADMGITFHRRFLADANLLIQTDSKNVDQGDGCVKLVLWQQFHCNTHLLKPTGTIWLDFTGICGQGVVVQLRHEWKSTVRKITSAVIFALLLLLLFGMKIKCVCYLLGWKIDGLLHSTQLRKQGEPLFTLGVISMARQTDCKALPYLRQYVCVRLVPLNLVDGIQFCRNGLSNRKSVSWHIYTFWGLTQLQLKSREGFTLCSDFCQALPLSQSAKVQLVCAKKGSFHLCVGGSRCLSQRMQPSERDESLTLILVLDKCIKRLLLFHISNSLHIGALPQEPENMDLSSLSWGGAGKENLFVFHFHV